jgi:hypothetical protein
MIGGHWGSAATVHTGAGRTARFGADLVPEPAHVTCITVERLMLCTCLHADCCRRQHDTQKLAQSILAANDARLKAIQLSKHQTEQLTSSIVPGGVVTPALG